MTKAHNTELKTDNTEHLIAKSELESVVTGKNSRGGEGRGGGGGAHIHILIGGVLPNLKTLKQ